MDELMRRGLLHTGSFIAGRWEDLAATYPVRDPATGESVAAVARAGRGDAERAIASASEALPGWRATLAGDRGGVLRRWADAMRDAETPLATLVTRECGKPLAESRGEVRYAASFLTWFGEEARRITGEIVPGHAPGTRVLVTREPLGVIGLITPWNFPLAMLTRKLGAALAAGCTAVCKPSELTPLSAHALAALGQGVGVPPGVVNVVSGDAAAIGDALLDSPIVRGLSFTGSTAVGRMLARRAADTLKRVSLELGGNAPFLVFDDADLDAAVAGAVASRFRNAGQTCVCAQRFLVQEGIADAFLARFTAAVRALRVGPGLDPAVDVGPLVAEEALARVEALVADALAQGAVPRVGGRRHVLGGTYFEPTVLTGVTAAMGVMTREIFGPVAAVSTFQTEAEAIAVANAVEAGLAAYVYTRDVGRVLRVCEALEVGMVGVNTGLISTPEAPFGGVKASGMGREGGSLGIEAFTTVKTVHLTG